MAKSIVEIIISAVNKTKQGLQEPVTDLKSLVSAVDKVGPAFKLAGGAAVVALAMMSKQSIDAADAFQQMKERTGVAVETLSTLGYAALQSDTDIQSLGKGMKGLSERMLDAAEGGKENAELFKRLKVEVANADGSLRKVDDVMFDLAGSFSTMKDGAEKNALAVRVFGKAGEAMIPMLNEGKEGLAGLAAEARIFGQEISGETAEAAAAFNDNIDKLTAANTGLINSFVSGLMPSLRQVSDEMVNQAKDGSILQETMRGIGNATGFVIRMFGAAFTGIAAGIKLSGAGFAGLAQVLWKLANRDFAGARDAALDLGHYVDKTLGDVKKSWTSAWDPELPKVAGEEGKKAIDGVARSDKAAAEARKKAAAEAASQAKADATQMGDLLLALAEADKAIRLQAEDDANFKREFLLEYAQAELEIAETEKRHAEEKMQLDQEVAALERSLLLERMSVEEQEVLTLQSQHLDRLKMIDDLQAKGLDAHTATRMRMLEIDNLDAQITQKRIDRVKDIIDGNGAMTRGLIAGMNTFRDNSVGGGQKVEKAFQRMWLTFRESMKDALAARAAAAIVNLAATKIEALASAAFWATPAALAATATAGVSAGTGSLAITGAIAATKSMAAAHGGLDYVPKETTYLLDRGERVISPKQNIDLTNFLAGKGAGGRGLTHVSVYLDKRVILSTVADATDSGELVISARSVK